MRVAGTGPYSAPRDNPAFWTERGVGLPLVDVVCEVQFFGRCTTTGTTELLDIFGSVNLESSVFTGERPVHDERLGWVVSAIDIDHPDLGWDISLKRSLVVLADGSSVPNSDPGSLFGRRVSILALVEYDNKCVTV
jgi:hypothetical protein